MASRIETVSVTPESIIVTRVEVFRVGDNWPFVVKRVLERKGTGCIELHYCQGNVGIVQCREKEK
jgi:hypothetical protein